ncbi:SubName: Full=Uncharacterized protein {ECO:0000313/EMBL:CCA71848.1} [Serendipita indica DSM 11827]|uniref:C2H2-type domain-containing protein n=1 Tax=Serendipita indica (strain DSM 11827) TaxID=1109443 RepID=G4TKK5_SERID|nr:SubName: Full=Uncharacterized protein {ECO:0000313/EMBL:CCA71848.1} [Serendipita indica DSM 11827]CCA71848.1 hypothetical protein PIIN_05783 [Serendipita indica DSM 11827]
MPTTYTDTPASSVTHPVLQIPVSSANSYAPELHSVVHDHTPLPHVEPNGSPITSTQPLISASRHPSQNPTSISSSVNPEDHSNQDYGSETFIQRTAPPGLRSRLRKVLNSSWFRQNQLEKRRELELFIIEPVKHEWKCALIPCADSPNVWQKKQRAVDHIRTHLNHRPFSCRGRCKRPNCTLAFFSERDLTSHMKPVSVTLEEVWNGATFPDIEIRTSVGRAQELQLKVAFSAHSMIPTEQELCSSTLPTPLIYS